MKSFLIVVLCCLLFVTCTTSKATELRLGGWSKHLNNKESYNENHHAFLLEHENVLLGYFKNSHNSDTVALGFYKHWQVDTNTQFGITGGITYGYRDCKSFNKYSQARDQSKNICPMLYPEIRWDFPLRPGLSLFGNALVLTIGFEI